MLASNNDGTQRLNTEQTESLKGSLFTRALLSFTQADSLIALGFFVISFYVAVTFAYLFSFGFNVFTWILILPVTVALILGLLGYGQDIIYRKITFSKQALRLGPQHFNLITREKSLLYICAAYMAVYLALSFIVPGGAVAYVLALLFPASYALIARGEDALSALKPNLIIELISALNLRYVLMLVLALSLYFCADNIFKTNAFPSFIFTSASAAFALAFVHFTGEAIIDKYERMEIEPPEIEQQAKQEKETLRQFEMQVYHYIRGDEFDKAAHYIESQISASQKDGSELINDDCVHQFLVEGRYTAVAIRHADSYIKRCVKQQKPMQAWQLLMFIMEHSERYYISHIPTLAFLMKYAVIAEHHDISISLLLRLARLPKTSQANRQKLLDKALALAIEHCPEREAMVRSWIGKRKAASTRQRS